MVAEPSVNTKGPNGHTKHSLQENKFKNPLIQQTSSKKSFTIKEPAAQEKKEKKNIPLNLQKDIFIVLLVMILFLLAERNREMMTVSKESSGRLNTQHMNEIWTQGRKMKNGF